MIHLKKYSCYWTEILSIIFSFTASIFFIDTSSAAYRVTVQRNYDTQHIKLKLNFDLEQKAVFGEATISLLPLRDNFSSFELHARNLEIREVMLSDHTPVSFLADSENVIISLSESYSQNDTITLIITYYVKPTMGIYFNESNKENPNTPYQIYSHSEPIAARCWFPCYDEPDDKVTSEIIATVPENYYLLSNGRLLSVNHDRNNHTKSFHWLQDKPHSTYLISFTAGEYTELCDRYEDVPLYYYVPKNQIKDAPNSFAKTPKMMECFQNLFGYKYPWDKYAQIVVANYQSLGMEHTSATTLNDRIIHDHRAHLDDDSDGLVAHELAHQWSGDLVTCKNWAHIWLNEGFATYAEILFKEFDSDAAEVQYAIYQDQKFYLEMVDPKFHQPIVYENYAHPDDMFSSIEYQKAGLVLHMLRYVIGDSSFFKSLQVYLQKYAYQSVETSDFQQVVEDISGQKLDWFFEQWLYRGGHPQFSITSRWIPETKKVFLYIHQIQQDSLGLVPRVFQMPVDIEIIGSIQRVTQKIFLKARDDTFSFAFKSQPVLIRFDKNNWILKEMNFIKSQDEWIYQLLNDENVGARLFAMEQLPQATFDTLKTVLALEKCLLADPFWAARKEAANLLIDYHRLETKQILIRACHDPHSKVRAAAILALSYYFDKTLNSLFQNLASNDSSYKVIAEALYALSHVPDNRSFDFIARFVDLYSYDDVIRTAALYSLQLIKDERAIPIAVRFATDPLQPECLRSSALSILKEVGIGHDEVETTLIKVLTDSNIIIQKKAIDILGSFKTARSLHALKAMQAITLPDDVRRRLRISIEKIERGLNGN